MVPDINLIPKLEQEQTGSKVLYMILGIVVLLVLTFFTWQYFGARSNIVTLQGEETNLIKQRDNLKTELEVLTAKNQSSLEQSIEFVKQVSYPVSPIIDETQNLQPDHSYLREYSFEAESVTIKLDFETLEDVSEYVSRLTNSPYFKDVQVSEISNNDFDGSSESETDFNVVPRQQTVITLFINQSYLATGGVQ